MAQLCSLASAVGARTSILGFSFNDHPTLDSIRTLRSLPRDVRLCVRDPVSYERLASHLDRPIDLVADVAFVLKPNADTATAIAVCRWIEEEKRGSRVVVGVNLNHRLFLGPSPGAVDNVMAAFRSALIDLFAARADLSFLLMPHDYRPYRGYPGDLQVAEELLASLPAGIRAHSTIVGKCRASEIRAVCGRVDLVVTGLMHLAIAALDRETPVACLSYQGKFEGLLSHFGVDGLIMDPRAAVDDLARFVGPLIEQREDIRNRIATELPRIRRLAQANFT
jgi:polysaccharide pyruvyl transferase WcaK-like protein